MRIPFLLSELARIAEARKRARSTQDHRILNARRDVILAALAAAGVIPIRAHYRKRPTKV